MYKSHRYTHDINHTGIYMIYMIYITGSPAAVKSANATGLEHISKDRYQRPLCRGLHTCAQQIKRHSYRKSCNICQISFKNFPKVRRHTLLTHVSLQSGHMQLFGEWVSHFWPPSVTGSRPTGHAQEKGGEVDSPGPVFYTPWTVARTRSRVVCMYICIYSYMHVCMYVCLYVCIYVWM